MNTLVVKLSKPLGFVGMILLFATVTFSFVSNVAAFPDGFLPVVGHLLYILFDLTIWVAVPLTLVLRRTDWLKYVLPVVFGYWLISMTYTMISNTSLANGNYGASTIAMGVFCFFTALCFLGAVGLGLTSVLTKKRLFVMLAYCLLVGSLVFLVVIWLICMIRYSQFDADWTRYIDAFPSYLFTPAGLLFAALPCLADSFAGTESAGSVD